MCYWDFLTNQLFYGHKQRCTASPPDIQFTCNGVITKWTIGTLDLIFSNAPELQVWQLIGENCINVSSSLFRSNETNHKSAYLISNTSTIIPVRRHF